jgi:hypothetical protein
MDLTSIVSLMGMFVFGVVCILKTKVVVDHVLHQYMGSHGREADLSPLKKQLFRITYYGGWFFTVLSIALGLLYLFAP